MNTDFITAGEGSAEETYADLPIHFPHLLGGQQAAKTIIIMMMMIIATQFLLNYRWTECILEMFPRIVLGGDLV